ncbi:hypothetical protein Peur_055198 [Populus x canadensis]
MVFLRCIRGLDSPSSGLSYVAENPVANVGGVLDVAASVVIGFNQAAAAADREEWRCTAEGSDVIGRPNE